MSTILKVCPKHGECKYYLNGKYYRCTKCNVEAVQARRDNLKLMAIKYMGGKCQSCGYDKCMAALEFHHKDPSEKEFGIGHKGYTRSFEKVKNELDKCVMLCANCHREEHERLRNC